MFHFTRQEQLIALVLAGGIVIGGAVLYFRRETAPAPPAASVYEFSLKKTIPRDDGGEFLDDGKAPPASEDASAIEKFDLNTATAIELEEVPGIGPKTAREIIEYRDKNGPFKDVAELQEIRGIGPKKADKFSKYLKVAKETGE